MRRRAYLVGINDYAPAGSGGPDLNGCVDDVKDMAETLGALGFAHDAIRISTDRQATREAILKGLAWLVAAAGKGDSLVFYYSGHGSQIVDVEGDEAADHKDEILCPHDIDFRRKIYIRDDDLKTIIQTLAAGTSLEVILDCCYSGTGTREPGKGDDAAARKARIRYLAPPPELALLNGSKPGLPIKGLFKKSPAAKDAVPVKGLSHTLWAACRDNQTSEETEIQGRIRGVFTYHFRKELRRTKGALKRKELDRIVGGAIRRGGFSQVPQLEASEQELLEKPFV
jgi:hypothetical protein